MGRSVLHVIDSGGLYGAEKMILSLSLEQQRQGLSPTILSSCKNGEEPREIESVASSLGIPVKRWESHGWSTLMSGINIIRWCRSSGFDVVHSHGYKYNVLIGAIPRVLRRIPFIATIHGSTVRSLFSKTAFYWVLDTLSRLNHDAIVYVSRALKDAERNPFIFEHRKFVIPNGLALEPGASSRGSEAIKHAERNRYVLFLGRLSYEKGCDVLIDSFSRIDGNSDVRLLIAGTGPEEGRLKGLARSLGLKDRVKFLGFVRDTGDLISQASAIVLPSRSEGLPITLLEGMRAGVPIVASAVGGIPNALDDGDGGILVPPDDAEALSKGISTLLGNTELGLRRSNHSYKRFIADFSADAMAVRYGEVYGKLLNG